MGAGKTCLGAHVARLLSMAFYDSDLEVERRCGADIGWIFDIEQESGFRKREAQVIDELSQSTDVVLSTGHSAVVTAVNQDCFRQRGIVVYLNVSLDVQLERARRRIERRPMVEGEDYHEKVVALNASRAPIYEALADLSYNTDHIVPKVLAQAISDDINRLLHG